VLVVAGLRVGVAIDDLQCPLGILKLHLCVFLLLRVHLLLALPLAGRRAILALLLHHFAELFRKLLDLSALRCAMTRGVVHRALRATIVTIGRLTGAFVASRSATAPTRRSSLVVVVVVIAAALGLCPSVGLALSLCPLGDWGVSGAALRILGALVHQTEERRNILDAVGGELLQHLLIPYSLMKCNHYRSIGDTRNGIANLREPLDEGAQGFPRALLDGVEIGLITQPSISALEVGRELVTQL
jgi:hypothetical protein